MRRFGLLIVLAVLAAFLTACGGDVSTATPAAGATAPARPAVATPTTPSTPAAASPTAEASTPSATGAPSAASPTVAPSPAAASPAASPVAGDRVAAAQLFISQLAAGDYANAAKPFDTAMQQALPQDKLQATWEQLLAQVGAFQSQGATQTSQAAQGGVTYDIVVVTCMFEKATINARLVFNPQGQIGGLRFSPAGTPTPAPAQLTPAPYVTPGAFQEHEVQVHSGTWVLTGTLSVPAGAGPFPAVVLVQGSGPSDRDESVGANKPFRDLAWGLASRGIAVLRYDKRTFLYPAQMAALTNVTVKDETTDDVLAAAAMLRQTDKVDPARVYILGHSLGAMLAPRMGAADPKLAGLIIMAGNTRPFEDLLVEQYAYLFSLDGTISAAEQQQLDQIRQQVARVKDPSLSTATPAADLPLGVPASYWLDLRDYHPADVAKTLTMRMLIMQGGRDYQVSPTADFKGWQDALAGHPNVVFKTYPAVDHLFLPGSGPSTPAEYNVPSHVEADVITDIAAWITAPSGGGGNLVSRP